MDEHTKKHIGWNEYLCDQTFGATGEEAFGKESDFYFHRIELADCTPLE